MVSVAAAGGGEAVTLLIGGAVESQASLGNEDGISETQNSHGPVEVHQNLLAV